MTEKIGLRIKTERMKLKLTQVELAERVNISSNFLGEIERGSKSCSIDTLIGFANFFDVSTDYLIYGNKKVRKTINETELKSQLYYLYHNIESLHKNYIPMVIEILRMISKFLQSK